MSSLLAFEHSVSAHLIAPCCSPKRAEHTCAQHGSSERSPDKLNVGNEIGRVWPLAFSVFFHALVLLLLSLVGGPAGNGLDGAARPEPPRLSVRLAQAAGRPDAQHSPAAEDEAVIAKTTINDMTNPSPAGETLPGNALITTPSEVYYTASEVDTRAAPVTAIELETEEVRMLAPNAIGKIVLKLWIDQSGKVDRVTPLASDMSSTITDQAVAAFSNAQYQPATRQGKAVKTISVIEVNYSGVQ
jgi:hypothetical protein